MTDEKVRSVTVPTVDVHQVAPAAPAPPLPMLDLAREDLDRGLIKALPPRRLLDANILPVRRLADGRVLVVAAAPPTPQLAGETAAMLGAPIAWAQAELWGIRSALLDVFADRIAADASDDLFHRNPAMSARRVLSRGQVIGGLVLLAVLAAVAVVWPTWFVIGVITLIGVVFLAGTVFKFSVALRGAQYDVVQRISDADIAAIDESTLPTYTVLVPVFHEENIVAQLVRNLGALDWPADRLEVLVLIEEEDDLTRGALAAAHPPANFHVVTIPKGFPQTKPRACNVGLTLATGDYVVIYDAEDSPDPDQLKKAWLAFQSWGDETVCVQASLNYFNATENALTRMFTLEYNYWFDYMLAGLDALELPIPLGGTSNHFRTSALTRLGGWDPYNVTEDADLGIRASALGYRVGVIDSTTLEEANTSIPNFVRQRSRWIKGYMQTTLVHARHPVRLIREIGCRRFLSFALLVGGTPATFLGVIPLYLVTAATLLVPTPVLQQFFPVWLLWLCLVNFVIGSSVMVYLTMMGPYKRGSFELERWALLNPVYWILHSVAAYKALGQLIVRPHYWEKTDHGLTAQQH